MEELGYEIIEDVIENPEEIFEEIKTWMTDTFEIEKWKLFNLPYGPRYGMYQGLVGHCPTIWKLREKVAPIFAEKWDCETTDLITSIDGASVFPPMYRKTNDWPHIDQTGEGLKCYQGQVVLTNTTASFVCTPRSHLKHQEVVDLYDAKDNWCKVPEAKELFDEWQIPIIAKAGSMILWDSRLIHSAKRQDRGDDSWRCVVYICQRPKSHYTKRNLTTIKNAAINGRTTNHWGSRTFPKKFHRQKRNDIIDEYSENPEKLSYIKHMTPLMKSLCGLKS